MNWDQELKGYCRSTSISNRAKENQNNIYLWNREQTFLSSSFLALSPEDWRCRKNEWRASSNPFPLIIFCVQNLIGYLFFLSSFPFSLFSFITHNHHTLSSPMLTYFLHAHSLGLTLIVICGWRKLLLFSSSPSKLLKERKYKKKLNTFIKLLFYGLILSFMLKTIHRNGAWMSRKSLFE